ncbi:MFS transporter [Nonomuraea sp. NPDC050663]|uniref:MFS transporter n=1 Tax=Nonomuraea sp. NPDC050663 TaxID=3364370 RepID=UPI0037AB0D60
MADRPSLPFRLARAFAFAAVSTVLGVLAHSFAGGTVAPVTLLAAVALSLATSVPAAGRERGTGFTMAALAAQQAVVHLLFSLSHDAAAVGAHGHSGLVPGLGMLVMHGWAVALTALWLARGEAALWALLRRLAVRLSLVFPAPIEVPFHAAPHAEPLPPRSALLRHAVSGRAPPCFS